MSEDDWLESITAATISAFRVEADDGGFRVSWGGDPLDFIWQTRDQLSHLRAAIDAALETEPLARPPFPGRAGEME